MVFNDFEHISVLILGSEYANPVAMATQSVWENVNIPINLDALLVTACYG